MDRILIIDDEKSIPDLLREALTRFGYDVAGAESAPEGIQKFESGQFDLVITDMQMPRMNGDAVVEHIRNSNKWFTPIIGCSGTPWLLEKYDFDMVLAKPFQLRDLRNAIDKLFAGFSTREASSVVHAGTL